MNETTDLTKAKEASQENTCATKFCIFQSLKEKVRSLCCKPDKQSVAKDLPLWLLTLLFITMLTMSSQIKLPFKNGLFALADFTFALSFLGILYYSLREKEKVYYPLAALVGLILLSITAWFSVPGKAGAFEIVKYIQQFFCGFLIFSFFIKHASFTLCLAVSVGLIANFFAAIFQTALYGYSSIQAPADVLALPWGFGKALTGFFRSRMALSLYFASALVWIQPQWLGRKPGFWRCVLTCAATILLLAFIPHGMILLLCLAILLFTSLFLHKRAILLNIIAAAVIIFSLVTAQDSNQRTTVLTTLTPLKVENYPGELKTCHLDFIAALRMAAKKPFYGVGPGRYQEFIGLCYGELPNPNYNDIDSDTQAGWGIYAGTLGFLFTAFFAFLILLAIVKALQTHLSKTDSNASCLQLGGFAALSLFFLAMFISNPLTRGLCWFFIIALVSAILPTKEAQYGRAGFAFWKIILSGIVLALILVPIVRKKAVADPLSSATLSFSGKRIMDDAQKRSASIRKDSDFFLVINASEVKEFTAPFEKHQDSQAAGNLALRIPDEKGVPPEGKEPAMEYGGALFEIEIPRDISCEIWVRTWWEGSCGNTLNLQIGDEERSVTLGNDSTYYSWHWVKSPRSYNLKAGKYNLRLLNREDGIALDQILITSDKDYFPQDIEEQQ